MAALHTLGGFFVLRTSAEPTSPESTTPDIPASPAPDASARVHGRHLPTLARTYAPRTPPDVHFDPLAVRVRRVGAALRTPEPRVAASVAQQGLAARLWSVALGCAALYGSVPDLGPGLLRWDPEGSAPDDLWLSRVSPLPGDAASLARIVLDGHLTPLNSALRARYGPAAGLLWGNAASALAGTARELDRWARRHGRTDVAARTRDLAAGLLRHPLLATAGEGAATATAFRRRSCCLYYRVPGGGLCGDCCFTRPPRDTRTAPGRDA
ncbi:ferric iron reductase [Streptomyces sp. NPDC005925]|uniref:ferric iron reductase n=1 Tax=Streptomyces sp. NPDC005925 TaxID=3157172 RepID=UPI0033C3E48C